MWAADVIWLPMCVQSQLEHTRVGTHAIAASWHPSKWFVSRHPSFSAGLNKSHQAGSDSSCVDRMPNVIWRLGEHGIGLNCASLCDVILGLDGSVQPRSLTHKLAFTQTSQKCVLTHSAGLTYYPLSTKRRPSVHPRTHARVPPPVCFVLHVPFPPPHVHDPSCHRSHCHASVPKELPALPDTNIHTRAHTHTLIFKLINSCTRSRKWHPVPPIHTFIESEHPDFLIYLPVCLIPGNKLFSCVCVGALVCLRCLFVSQIRRNGNRETSLSSCHANTVTKAKH